MKRFFCFLLVAFVSLLSWNYAAATITRTSNLQLYNLPFDTPFWNDYLVLNNNILHQLVIQGPAVSVDGEVMLFNGTNGKTAKRASITGIAKLTAGVLSAATEGVDYLGVHSGVNGMAKLTAGVLSAATEGVDYLGVHSGVNGMAKLTAGVLSAATEGVDYLAPLSGTTDETLPRFNGTAGILQKSLVRVDDSGGLTVAADIVTRAPIEKSSINNCIDAPLYFPPIAVSSGSAHFVPMLYSATSIGSGIGFNKHVSIGQYRTGSAWDGGIYFGQGGNDNFPTEYFLMEQGGILSHSGGGVQLQRKIVTISTSTSITSGDIFICKNSSDIIVSLPIANANTIGKSFTIIKLGAGGVYVQGDNGNQYINGSMIPKALLTSYQYITVVCFLNGSTYEWVIIGKN